MESRPPVSPWWPVLAAVCLVALGVTMILAMHGTATSEGERAAVCWLAVGVIAWAGAMVGVIIGR